MPAFTSILALLFGLMSAVLGVAPFSNDVVTETPAPQELGAITADGSLVYSLNMCTIVHSTTCQTSMSTGGAAPTPGTGESSTQDGATVSEGGGYQSDSVPAYTGDFPAASLTSVVTSTTDAEGSPTTVTQVDSSTQIDSSEQPTDVVTATDDQLQPTAPNDSPLPTSTGASNSVGMHPGVAVGAGALAMAWML